MKSAKSSIRSFKKMLSRFLKDVLCMHLIKINKA